MVIAKRGIAVLVCGGRGYSNKKRVNETMDSFHAEYRIISVIEGGAEGADKLAREWAKERNVHRVTVKADWDKHGRAAGPIRNGLMLSRHNPDLVVAFPGGRGTENMISKAMAKGVAVIQVEDLP